MCVTKLLRDIENCREEMISLASTMSLESKQVIEASKRLDKLINHYHKLTSDS